MGVVLLIGAVGAGAGWAYYQGAAAAPPAEADRSEPEQLRRELGRLRADLRRATERVAALEARLKGPGAGAEEVVYRGKPTAHWAKVLKDRDPGYRKEASRALAAIGRVNRAVIPVLAGILKDGDADAIAEAATGLAGIGRPAVPSLTAALQDPGQRNRAAVMHALGQMGPDAAAATPVLIEILKGKDRNERWAAAHAIACIGPAAKVAVPALIALLKEPVQMGEPEAAAYALGHIGPEAKAAVPALLEAQRNLGLGEGPTQATVAQALQQIDPAAAAKIKGR
jgi:HEAT repeat protein